MKKKDLRDGYIVEYRNGDLLLKLGNKLYSQHYNSDSLDSIDDDLFDLDFDDIGNSNFDIVGVYKIKEKSVLALPDIFNLENLVSLWSR